MRTPNNARATTAVASVRYQQILFLVAQSYTLLYRRVALGCGLNVLNALNLSRALQSATLRYSRVELCATPAPFHAFQTIPRGGSYVKHPACVPRARVAPGPQ